MRIVLGITPQEDTPQPLSHHHMGSAFYKVLTTVGLDWVHSLRRYKYFCFSNIYPFKPNIPFKAGEKLSWIISTPSQEYASKLIPFFSHKPEIRFGRYRFNVTTIKSIKTTLKNNVTVYSATPIITKIPMHLFSDYHITIDKEFAYWNSDSPLNAFVDLLSKNMIRKYNEFTNRGIEEKPLPIRYLKFKGMAVVSIVNKAKGNASMWELGIDTHDSVIRDIITLGMDAGFGEKNAFGFGFMNISSPRK